MGWSYRANKIITICFDDEKATCKIDNAFILITILLLIIISV